MVRFSRFTMHDLMHDMAKNIAGNEFCIKNPIHNVDKKVRHLALMRGKSSQCFFTHTRIRSYLSVGNCYVKAEIRQSSLEVLLEKWKYLRVLDLSNLAIDDGILPDFIGELLHLRFLDLSRNWWLEMLTKIITKLYNLQTLK